MTTGDLVRNEIFSRVADRPPNEVESLDEQYWQPFYERFKLTPEHSSFDGYFFPFGLIKDPNLKKSDVYAHLRNLWKDEKSPAAIIKDLAIYQQAFLDVERGSNLQGLSKPLAQAVGRLSIITPTSTYPFIMRLLKGLASLEIEEADGLSILGILESFLVRRAICGHEPTGLHAVFKGLWIDCEGSPTATRVEAAIRAHKTVVWPTTDEVKACAVTRPLYGSGITNFLLVEWNKGMGGDVPGVIPWIEHVLPDTISDGWKLLFSEKQHEAMKDRLANLLPLSQPMNQGLGNKDYQSKRKIYESDSMYKAAREFAKEFSIWGPVEIEKRSKDISEWVAGRWPNQLCVSLNSHAFG